MAACWPLDLPPVQKFVLISLADQANDGGVCWPTVASICARTCFGERAVQNALRELQQRGLLDVEIGANKANRYTIANQAVLSRDAHPRTTCAPHDVHPAPLAPRMTCTPHDVHPQRAPARGARAANTNTNTNTNTPPIPPDQGRGAEGREPAAADNRSARGLGTITLRTYLEACKAQGTKPIPPGDPVFAYCERVGISNDILMLHWREFKARRLATEKRQADWPKTFLNSVKSNWYRLWFMRPGEMATLSTQGLQAQAEMLAEQRQKREEVAHGPS